MSYPARATSLYVNDLLAAVDGASIRHRALRLVVDYCYSPAALILPSVLGSIGVETITAHADVVERLPAGPGALHQESVETARRLVPAVGADLGVVVDQAGERILVIDEHGEQVGPERLLLLVVSLLAGQPDATGTVAVPITTTSRLEELVAGSGLEVERTATSLAALTRAAARPGVLLAASAGGGFVFPRFLPAYDACASVVHVLELLARAGGRTVSELARDLPEEGVVHAVVRCPWALKGTVMRVLTERAKGRRVDLLDGIKVFDERGWLQVLPDPDEPVVHVYAEGRDRAESDQLEREASELVAAIVAGTLVPADAAHPV
ncbi:MAG: hypothetical protein R3C15_06550 [Thermoleophilia bacterium]